MGAQLLDGAGAADAPARRYWTLGRVLLDRGGVFGHLGAGECADAEGEGSLVDGGEAGGGDVAGEGFGGEEGVDGSGEVAVGAGAVAGDEGGGDGHDVVAVEVVGPADGWESGLGELEDDEAAAGSEDAAELAECASGLGDIADAEGDGDDIEGGIVEGECHGIALNVGGDGIVGVSGGSEAFCAGDVEHFGGEVESDDAGWACIGEGAGEVAGAAGDIEDVIGGFDGGDADGGFSPCLVASEGVEAVVEVVCMGDGAEHASDLVGLLGVEVGIVGELGVVPGSVGGSGLWGGGGGHGGFWMCVRWERDCGVGREGIDLYDRGTSVVSGARLERVMAANGLAGMVGRAGGVWRGMALGVLGVVMAVGSGGCSTNPATGRSQLNLLSRQQEIQMGTEAMGQLTQEYGGVVSDRQLQAYVTRVGMSMVPYTEADYADLPWEFTLLDSDVINAFALPGGKVFVSRGLAQKMTNEAQLAAVLGHEIGHVTARHANDRISRQLVLAGVVAGASIAAGQSDDDLIRIGVPVLVGTAGTGFALSFDRGQETESDKLGMRYMTRAGYDPRGMLQLMQILEAESGAPSQPEWLSTHPLPSTRIREIERQLTEGRYSEMVSSPEYGLYQERFEREFLSRMNRLSDAGMFVDDVPEGEVVPILWGGFTGACGGCSSCGGEHGGH